MKVVFAQADLDTALTAMICGVALDDEIVYRRGGAEPSELADPIVLCIEAGGSGEVERHNYDHHKSTSSGGGSLLPPACVQAWRARGAIPH